MSRSVLLMRRIVLGMAPGMLLAMVGCARAQSLMAHGTKEQNAELLGLVDYFCASARLRMERGFAGLSRNADKAGYRAAQDFLKSGTKCLADGIVHQGR